MKDRADGLEAGATITRLVAWYASQCNGDWEHTYGLTIETLDNPGWAVKVELVDTPLYELPFSPLVRGGDTEWIHCEVKDGVFRGSGGTGQLDEVLRVFLDWAERTDE